MVKAVKGTAVWECPNGHWGRVEFILADGLFSEVLCPVCAAPMVLGTRQLETIRSTVCYTFNRNYIEANKRKGRGKNAKANNGYRSTVKRPCGFES